MPNSFKRPKLWVGLPYFLILITFVIMQYRSDNQAETAQKTAEDVRHLSDQRDIDNKINAYNLCIYINDTRSAVQENVGAIIDLSTNEMLKQRVAQIQKDTIGPLDCPEKPVDDIFNLPSPGGVVTPTSSTTTLPPNP